MYHGRIIKLMDELDDIKSQVSLHAIDPASLQQTELTHETADRFVDIASQCGCQLEQLLDLLNGEE